MNVYEKIEAQTKGKDFTDVWMVGRQLADIIRGKQELEEIVAQDLEVTAMSLAACAKEIKAWADEKQKELKTKCVCVPPEIADGIIRKFYGLPDAVAPAMTEPVEDDFDFADFL